MTASPPVVTVCVPLSADPTAAIHQAAEDVGHRVTVHYRPHLLPPQRFVADHRGAADFVRTPAAEREWLELLAATTVAFGIPGDDAAGLGQLTGLAAGLNWVQGTAAGAGESVVAADLPPAVLARVRFTSAAGIHAVPLAEFALFGLLAMAKDLDELSEANAARQWRSRWPMRLLRGSHVVVVGLGGVGQEVARLLGAFGATVTGVRRTAAGDPPPGVSRVIGLAELGAALPSADSVVLTLPGTAQTRGLFDEAMLARMPAHAALVNVGRGSVVDSAALINALDRGALRGAVLDVTDAEPLPYHSTLWQRPNVVLSPHTAALSVDEDLRLTELFADNLRRFLDGRPLRNLVDTSAGY